MDAVAVAADGATADNPGVCHIEPGTYTAANAFDATKTHLIILDVPVRLVGNGASPDAVVIDGLQQRRLVSVTHGGATVENPSHSTAQAACRDRERSASECI